MTLTTERPTVATRQMVEIQPLVTYEPTTHARGTHLPQSLRDAYGSDLWLPLRTNRPTVIANFVATLDGVVSFNTPDAMGGGEISGFSKPDRFVMGLLRSMVDAVLIGAGTLRAAPNHQWTPTHTHPQGAADFLALREQLGLAPVPTTVVVTASGDVDLAHTGLADRGVPVTIITTDKGQAVLQRRGPFPAQVEVVTATGDNIEPSTVIEILRDHGMKVVLTEGGPHLFGLLVGAKLVDELFLTIAPQIAGRSADNPRLALVEGTAFTVGDAPWSRLVDLRRSDSHLFARYRLQETK